MRKKFIIWLFMHSQKIYTHFKKKTPWKITKKQLKLLNKESFGYALAVFLEKNSFELIPKVERHDAYHVLTNYGTEVQDEIALQYLCYGNGKRSLYLYAVILIGTAILPDYLRYYIRSYHIGKEANSFHHLDYEKLVNIPLDHLRSVFFHQKQILKKLV